MKILSTEEGREKFKETLILKLKSQKAREATVLCISEGIGKLWCVASVEISAGESAFLPLKVTVTDGGGIRDVSSVQPDGAEFDYAALCEEFNAMVADNDAEKEEFLEKTAKLLEEKYIQTNIIDNEFSVKITFSSFLEK